MANYSVFKFIWHCAQSNQASMSPVQYLDWCMEMLAESRRLCNWDAVEVMQGLLCDAVMAMHGR